MSEAIRGAGHRALTILIPYLGPEIVNEEGRGSHFAGPGPRILDTVYVLLAEQAAAAHLLLMQPLAALS